MACWNKILILVLLSLVFYSFFASASAETVEDSAKKAIEDVSRWKPGMWRPCSNCHAGAESAGKVMPHRFPLESHDKLGTNRTKACFFCHDLENRDMLVLSNGTLTTIEDSPALCYKCHEVKYKEWSFGGHGRADWRCTDPRCHNPHQPRLTGIGLGNGYPLPPPPNLPKPPHVLAAEASPEPYYKATMEFFYIAIGIIVVVHIIALIGWKALGKEGGK